MQLLPRRLTRSFALAAAANPLPQTPTPVAAAPATSRRGRHRHLPSRAGGRSLARPPPPPHLLSLSQGREGNGRDPSARGGSAQICSRTSGPPSLEIVHGGPTRLQTWTETPESLSTRGGPTPQPPRKGRAPAAGHLRRPPTMVARIWTSCCSYCFRWTRTSPPSALLRLPTHSSYPLAWCAWSSRLQKVHQLMQHLYLLQILRVLISFSKQVVELMSQDEVQEVALHRVNINELWKTSAPI
ncbi:hypothetical protein ACQJBY_014112 [Aegilops geniculata]